MKDTREAPASQGDPFLYRRSVVRDMKRRKGDSVRVTSAPPDAAVIDNLPDLFPKEDWHAFYWSVTPEGELVQGRAVVRLPAGAGRFAEPVEIGQEGVIENIRRWGAAIRGGLLEAMGFDPTPYLTHDAARFLNDDAEALYLVVQATHFDLPGHFILGSDEHPFLLFDPEGVLKGSFTRWYTYAGALAFLVTDGNLQASFGLIWQDDRNLYRRVVKTLQEMLADKLNRNP